MEIIKLHSSDPVFEGTISLDGSKSISNRLLIINALSDKKVVLTNCSTSEDTKVLRTLLDSPKDYYNVGHAGTSFRFLTSYLALQDGTQILTGSERMKERPIQDLVKALNELGANIEYLEKEGFPPLSINTPSSKWKDKITIDASISSQFITSLLLIAPSLPNGLEIELSGSQVSLPYIKMTTSIMTQSGVDVTWSADTISVKHGTYKLSNYNIEADWSAASYYYAIAIFSKTTNIKLVGLFDKSLQGDQAIVNIGKQFGINTAYESDGIRIIKEKPIVPSFFEYDFLKCPDIAQTVMVIIAGLGIKGLYSGLETLKIKETDRFRAMKDELQKIGVSMVQLPSKFAELSNIVYYLSEGKAHSESVPIFESYQDHRMAMSLATLSVLFDISIKDPKVVNKSYALFWKDLIKLGIC